MKSTVYFVKVDTKSPEQRISALNKLLEKISPFLVYKKEEIIPVKVTIGDSACVYHIHPELMQCVVALIKTRGAKPFLFDTNVIYKGQRQNALDYLNLVESKGFGHSKVGAPFVIADGLLGQDGKEYDIKGANIQKIKIPTFIGMLESLVVLSHATGHMVSGFAGAIKNVAMGMSCRSTKQVQHSSLKPSVIAKTCTACAKCMAICPVNAISWRNEKAFIEQGKCIGCGECICACKFDAIFINWGEDSLVFSKRMVEVAHFILSKFRNKFFITFAFDITKECDCISGKGEQMIASDLGILASSDIVSLDKAAMDLALQHKAISYFKDKRSVVEETLSYAQGMGLGSLEYDLFEV